MPFVTDVQENLVSQRVYRYLCHDFKVLDD